MYIYNHNKLDIHLNSVAVSTTVSAILFQNTAIFKRYQIRTCSWITNVVYFILHCSHRALSTIKSQYSVQLLNYIVPRYLILQYHYKHSYMIRSLMGSSTG
jgi:hypothetical protein